MCEKAPGPRCASGAKKDIQNAEKELAKAIAQGFDAATIKKLENILKEKHYLYSITATARKELQKDIDENGDPDGSKRKDLEERKNYYNYLKSLVSPKDKDYIPKKTAKVSRASRPKKKVSNGSGDEEKFQQNRKTVIRELGVAAGIHGHDFSTLSGLSAKSFATVMEGDFSIHDQTSFHDAFSWGEWKQNEMPTDLKYLLSNGIHLGNRIREAHYNGLNGFSKSDIVWAGPKKLLGGDAPRDLIIAKDLWSLKANSDILKNGSAKDFYNTAFASNDFQTTLNPLRDLSVSVYEKHFSDLAKKHNEEFPKTPIPTSWEEWKNNKAYESMGCKNAKDALVYKKQAMGRMSTFSIYTESKTAINQAAAEAFMKRLPTNLRKIKVGELMGYNTEFYFGSITDKGAVITGKVPSATFMNDSIYVEKVWFTAARQLNIFIELQNKSKETFIMHNEVRYSHRQFTSNPEVKRKQASGSDIVHFMRS